MNLCEDLNEISKIMKTCEGPGEKVSRQRDEQVQRMRLMCSGKNQNGNHSVWSELHEYK